MAINIEIKAKASAFESQIARARDLANSAAEVIVQEDVFFHCRSGRLKLRIFGDGGGELIGYQRSDHLDAAPSDYRRIAIAEIETFRQAMAMTCGIRGVVRKRRTLFLLGTTRIHFDQVENLGEFIELEVVLNAGISPDQGKAIAHDLMAKLGIEAQDLIAQAYIDLLVSQNSKASSQLDAD